MQKQTPRLLNPTRVSTKHNKIPLEDLENN